MLTGSDEEQLGLDDDDVGKPPAQRAHRVDAFGIREPQVQQDRVVRALPERFDRSGQRLGMIDVRAADGRRGELLAQQHRIETLVLHHQQPKAAALGDMSVGYIEGVLHGVAPQTGSAKIRTKRIDSL